MGATNKSVFNQEHLEIADIAKAIAHPARVDILDYIINNPGCIANDIVNNISLSQPTISQHIRELRAINLISVEHHKTSISYYINQEEWNKSRKTINAFFKKVKKGKEKK
jgi:predicted transcriptional regulator